MQRQKAALFLFCLGGFQSAWAETHSLTLKQVVQTALSQNSELILSRLDEQKARAGIRIAKDPFVPKIYGGSGLAFTSGYPNSIEGSAPSIFQARTEMALFNRPRSYELAQARENARGAGIDTASKSDDIAYRAAALFLDARQFQTIIESLQQEVQAQERMNEAVRLRVEEGRDIPLAAKRAELDLARARQRRLGAESDADYAQGSLAVVLGFPAGDRIQPLEDESFKPETPDTEEATIQSALDNSKELKRMQSQMLAKNFEVRSHRSQRYPQFDLVAQYALFSKQNYQDFFRRFSRNNGQLGVSIKVPLLVGAAPSGLEAQSEADLAKLRTQINDLRNRTMLETRKGFQDVKRAESARDFAKLDLEVAREQVRVLLDQLTEGRTTRQAVDEGRFMEQEKWMAYYESQHLLEKAKLNLLRQTGNIQAALR